MDISRKANKGLENTARIYWLNAALQAIATTPLHLMLKGNAVKNTMCKFYSLHIVAIDAPSLSAIQEAYLKVIDELENNAIFPCDPTCLAVRINVNYSVYITHLLLNRLQ